MATAESTVNVTEGSGKKLHTISRAVGGNTVEDEVTVAGEPYAPSYAILTGSGISVATALAHPLQVMAGASLRVILRRLLIYQVAAATTAGFYDFLLLRLTTAGTGGTALTTVALDPADPAGGAAGMTLPTAKGTEGAAFWRGSLYFTQTIGASLAGGQPALLADLDFDKMRLKPPIIALGATNGLALKTTTGITGATIACAAYVSELPNF